MPAPGDQHKANGAVAANPFEEERPHISEYTALEIATLQSRLNKRLGPEYISTRPGPGNQKIAYLSAEKAINLANEVFGFNGWSSSIQQIQVDYVDDNVQTGKVSLGLSVVVRVTLKDGTYHEDIGYGGIDNCKGKAMAFEKSKKEATTDALKRALRNFGNVLGNCIYDKDYITKVSKLKAGPGTRFDVNDLHRHSDYVTKKDEEDIKPALRALPPAPDTANTSHTTGFDDSFDMGDFDDADFDEGEMGRPDEILLPPDPAPHLGQRNMSGVNSNNVRTPSKAPLNRPPSFNSANAGQRSAMAGGMPRAAALPTNRSHQLPASKENHTSSSPGVPMEHSSALLPGQAQQPPTPVGPSGFYSAKAAQNIDQTNSITANLPPSSARFNPHAESPSIRKTAGVDHNKSVPVRRDALGARGESGNTNIVNGASTAREPAMDARIEAGRRMGAPGPGSGPIPPQGHGQVGLPPIPRPGMSTSAYRPPMRHAATTNGIVHPPPQSAAPASVNATITATTKRPPLSDMSNMQHTAQSHNVTAITGDGVDAKRQKVHTPAAGTGGEGGGGGGGGGGGAVSIPSATTTTTATVPN